MAPGLGFHLREAYRAFARALDQRIADHGITHAQWVLLWFLQRAGASTPVGLSRAAGIKKASATGAIETLKRRGLIHAERDAADARRVNLTLTPAGMALMGRLVACAADANAKARAGIADRELTQLLRLLRRVTENLDRDGSRLGGTWPSDASRGSSRRSSKGRRQRP